jgi:hypothetical protein
MATKVSNTLIHRAREAATTLRGVAIGLIEESDHELCGVGKSPETCRHCILRRVAASAFNVADELDADLGKVYICESNVMATGSVCGAPAKFAIDVSYMPTQFVCGIHKRAWVERARVPIAAWLAGARAR